MHKPDMIDFETKQHYYDIGFHNGKLKFHLWDFIYGLGIGFGVGIFIMLLLK